MSLVISLHRWDGIGWYSGEYVLATLTVGFLTVTITTTTIEAIVALYRDY